MGTKFNVNVHRSADIYQRTIYTIPTEITHSTMLSEHAVRVSDYLDIINLSSGDIKGICERDSKEKTIPAKLHTHIGDIVTSGCIGESGNTLLNLLSLNPNNAPLKGINNDTLSLEIIPKIQSFNRSTLEEPIITITYPNRDRSGNTVLLSVIMYIPAFRYAVRFKGHHICPMGNLTNCYRYYPDLALKKGERVVVETEAFPDVETAWFANGTNTKLEEVKLYRPDVLAYHEVEHHVAMMEADKDRLSDLMPDRLNSPDKISQAITDRVVKQNHLTALAAKLRGAIDSANYQDEEDAAHIVVDYTELCGNGIHSFMGAFHIDAAMADLYTEVDSSTMESIMTFYSVGRGEPVPTKDGEVDIEAIQMYNQMRNSVSDYDRLHVMSFQKQIKERLLLIDNQCDSHSISELIGPILTRTKEEAVLFNLIVFILHSTLLGENKKWLAQMGIGAVPFLRSYGVKTEQFI